MSWFPACIIHVVLLTIDFGQWGCLCVSMSICVMNGGHCSSLVKHITDITILFCLFCIIFPQRQIDSDRQNRWNFDGKLTFRHYTKSKGSRADATLTFDILMCWGMHLTHCLHVPCWLTTTLKSQRYSGWCFNCFQEILAHDVDQLIQFVRIEPTLYRQSSWTQKIH